MFLQHILPSSLTPIIHFSSLYSFSSSSIVFSDQNPSFSDRSSNFLSFSKSPSPVSLSFIRRSKCRSSTRNESYGFDDDGEQYIQAMLLVPETARHYKLWKQGFVEETKWHSAAQKYPFSSHRSGDNSNIRSIGHGFLRRFQSPTVFLKIACDEDLLLPIIVGEIAIIKLIHAIAGEEIKEGPDQFQFVQNIVRTLGYEVKMVRITNRVVNTYYARIYLRKVADNTNISIDAHPSDALNVAERFKAPIYVDKEIVVRDAIKVVYGHWMARSSRIGYDVSLDSPAEEPDPLREEFDLVLKMNKAVVEERFEDAALWRDKLTKLLMPGHEL